MASIFSGRSGAASKAIPIACFFVVAVCLLLAKKERGEERRGEERRIMKRKERVGEMEYLFIR